MLKVVQQRYNSLRFKVEELVEVRTLGCGKQHSMPAMFDTLTSLLESAPCYLGWANEFKVDPSSAREPRGIAKCRKRARPRRPGGTSIVEKKAGDRKGTSSMSWLAYTSSAQCAVNKIAALKDKVRSLEAQVEALTLEAESRASTTAAVLAENEELRTSRDDLLHKMTGGLFGGLDGAGTTQSTADAVRGYVRVPVAGLV